MTNMAPDQIQELINEDRQLTTGIEVTAHWSSRGFYYRGQARIESLSSRKVRMVLLEDIGRNGEFSTGRRIEIPRITDPIGWSSENCVRMTRQLHKVA